MKGKVCLAYSGGLDTSCILKWLLNEGYEVVCYLCDIGQDEPWDEVKEKAKKIGATKMKIDDRKKEFVDMCWKAIQANAIYEGRYLLGTSLARPIIARSMMQFAKDEGCDFVSHGATAKGNDGIRFEFAFYAIDPKIKVIAPWREPSFFNRFPGRTAMLDFCAEEGIPVTSTKAKPYSMDANLAHCSYEAGQLEDPDFTPSDDMWTMTDDPRSAPDTPTDISVTFEKGIPVKLSVGGKEITESIQIFLTLNEIGKKAGVGRIDIVENRFIGLKSRGCYDSPCMTILRLAHLDIECMTLDGAVRSLKEQFVDNNWSRLLYQGLYFSPERELVENSLIFSQKRVNGTVRMRCLKGCVSVLGRTSETGLYNEQQASMDKLDDFNPVATSGFIEINAIRLKAYGMQRAAEGNPLSDSTEK